MNNPLNGGYPFKRVTPIEINADGRPFQPLLRRLSNENGNNESDDSDDQEEMRPRANPSRRGRYSDLSDSDLDSDEDVDPNDPFHAVPYFFSRSLTETPPQMPNGIPGMEIHPDDPYGQTWQRREFKRRIEANRHPMYNHVQTVAGCLPQGILSLFDSTTADSSVFTRPLISQQQATYRPRDQGVAAGGVDPLAPRAARAGLQDMGGGDGEDDDDDVDPVHVIQQREGRVARHQEVREEAPLPPYAPQNRQEAVSYLVRYGLYNQHTGQLVRETFGGETQYDADWASDFVHLGMQFMSPAFNTANKMALNEIYHAVHPDYRKHVTLHKMITSPFVNLDFAQLVAEHIKKVQFSNPSAYVSNMTRNEVQATINRLVTKFSDLKWSDGRWVYAHAHRPGYDTSAMQSGIQKLLNAHHSLLNKTITRGPAHDEEFLQVYLLSMMREYENRSKK